MTGDESGREWTFPKEGNEESISFQVSFPKLFSIVISQDREIGTDV